MQGNLLCIPRKTEKKSIIFLIDTNRFKLIIYVIEKKNFVSHWMTLNVKKTSYIVLNLIEERTLSMYRCRLRDLISILNWRSRKFSIVFRTFTSFRMNIQANQTSNFYYISIHKILFHWVVWEMYRKWESLYFVVISKNDWTSLKEQSIDNINSGLGIILRWSGTCVYAFFSYFEYYFWQYFVRLKRK